MTIAIELSEADLRNALRECNRLRLESRNEKTHALRVIVTATEEDGNCQIGNAEMIFVETGE